MLQQLLLVVSFCSTAIGQRVWTTPTIRDTTADDANKPDLTVTLSPVKNMYKEGEKVTITCTFPKPTDGTVEPEIVLQFGSVEKKGKGTVTYEVDKLTPEMNKQRKTCVVNTSKGTVPLQIIRLKVSYIPIVTTSSYDLNIFESNTARLHCQIKSFPQASVNWFVSGNQLDLSNGTRLSNSAQLRYTVLTESTWEEEKYVGTLEILQTRKSDSGYYTCEVCNSVGCNRSQIHLKVDDHKVPQPSGSVQKCCRDKGVRKECQIACSFDIDISAYDNNTDCFQEFPKLLQCAKDGVDHRQCCVRFGVSHDCLSLCNGQHTGIESEELSAKCAQFSRQIFTCIEEKQETSPGPPQNVKIFHLVFKNGTSGVVNVTWDPPVKNRDLVELYVVYHREIGNGSEDAEWANHLVNLKTLGITLGRTANCEGLEEIFSRPLGQLRVLEIRNVTNYTDSLLTQIANGCPLLDNLCLSTYNYNNPLVTDLGLDEIVNKCRNLTQLRLDSFPLLTGSSFIGSRDKLPKLKYLRILNCENLDEGAIMAEFAGVDGMTIELNI